MMKSLRRERSANNPIGYRYVDMIAARDALNRPVVNLYESSTGRNMNLLLGFAGWAFHRHHNIAFVGHREASVRRILPRSRRAPARTDSWACPQTEPEIKNPQHVGTGGSQGVNRANADHFTAYFPPPRKINRSVSSPEAGRTCPDCADRP